MISLGDHAMCKGGDFGWSASGVGNMDSAVGTRETGVKLGCLAHIQRADVHVCDGICGDCPLGWDGVIIFSSHMLLSPYYDPILICIFVLRKYTLLYPISL